MEGNAKVHYCNYKYAKFSVYLPLFFSLLKPRRRSTAGYGRGI